MKHLLIAATLAASSLAATGEAVLAQSGDDTIARELRQADQDGDGAVSRQELMQSRLPALRRNLEAMAERQIEEFDRNGDGVLSTREIVETRIDRLRALWNRRFDAIDANDDGRIDAEEMHSLR